MKVTEEQLINALKAEQPEAMAEARILSGLQHRLLAGPPAPVLKGLSLGKWGLSLLVLAPVLYWAVPKKEAAVVSQPPTPVEMLPEVVPQPSPAVIEQTPDVSTPAKPLKKSRAPQRQAIPSSTEVSELNMLLSARRALSVDDFQTALSWVGTHEATFAESDFVMERQAIEVLALCGLQENQKAREAMKGISADSIQKSPYFNRLQNSCVGPWLK